jgi:serine/threonine protein phosphatase PrpC
MHWEYFARTDLGLRRRRNEDAVLALPACRLYAVADGMGGHAAGDVASALALATLAAAFPGPPSPRIKAETLARRLQEAIDTAHQALVAQGRQHPAQLGMGTTITALATLVAEPACVIAHVGDSRAYRLRNRELLQLTHDHTWVQAQVDAGILTPLQAASHPYRNVLVRVLGGGGEPGPADVVSADAEPGDVFLLCTDGLCGVVANEDLETMVGRELPLATIAHQLVDAALLRGAPDNVTLVLLRAH